MCSNTVAIILFNILYIIGIRKYCLFLVRLRADIITNQYEKVYAYTHIRTAVTQ